MTETISNKTGDTRARVQSTPPPAEQSLGELFADLSSDTGELVRQEIYLAKAEIKETMGSATRSAIFMSAGGMLCYAGLIVLLFAIAAFLSFFMDLWLAHTIVGAVVIVLGVILLLSGRSMLKNLSLTPQKTIDTLKNDAQWAKEQVT